MKKLILISGFLLAIINMNAQYYIGGSLSLTENSSKNSEGKKIGFSNLNFSISPEMGYNYSEKIDIGISINFLSNSRKSYQFTPGEVNTKITTTGLGASPYIRYSFLKFSNFDLRGRLALNYSGNTIKYFNNTGTETDKFTSNTFGINIVPQLFYNLSNRVSLYTQLNFLGLDFSSTTEKTGDKKTGSTSGFAFGANSDNLLTFDQIRIGFIYKF